MKIQWSNEGIWITDGFHKKRLIRYQFVIFVLMVPVIFSSCIAVALNRSTNFKWFLHHHPKEALLIYQETLRTSAENLVGLEQLQTESLIPTLELYVPSNTLSDMLKAKLTGDPDLGHEPNGDRPYMKAWYKDESSKLQKAKISYRGLMHYHHWPEKPSLRIKIKKAHIASGQRYVELTRPKDALGIRHQIPEEIAKNIGLLTTINNPVRLLINKKYFGVYLRSYRPGESLALASHRMPGTFFKGDAVGHKSHHNLWCGSYNWDIYGEESVFQQDRFDQFLSLLNQPPSPDTYKNLTKILNTDIYAQFSAIMVISGSVHTDQKHNQMFYICSNQGLLEPVPWDPTCYEIAGKSFTPINTLNNPILNHLMSVPQWVHLRNQWIFKLINGPASASEIKNRVQLKYERMKMDLMADPNLSKKTVGTDRLPVSVYEIENELKTINQWADAKEKFIQDYLEGTTFTVSTHDKQKQNTKVKIAGNIAIKAIRKDGTAIECFDSTGGKTDLLYSGLSEEIKEIPFKPERSESVIPAVSSAPMNYTVNAPLRDIQFFNAITEVEIFPTNEITNSSLPPRTLPPSLFQKTIVKNVTIGPGEVVLKNNLIISKGQMLTIQPGTVIKLERGISIFSQGPVIALGTKEAPIKILPIDNNAWGCIGINGPETTGTKLNYLIVKKGSIGTNEGIQFKGMFNVYGCPNVRIKNCHFGKNFIGDDTVNIAESYLLMEKCTFEDAASDGLDLDMCQGKVTDCQWFNSGNDGLDMMTCQIHVKDCLFEGSGDKGISIGEASQVLVENSLIQNCKTGIEVKDNSFSAVMNSKLLNNFTGYHSYQKKWLYPQGGTTIFMDCTIENSKKKDFSLEKRSYLEFLRTKNHEVKTKKIRELDELTDLWKKQIRELKAL